jgi:hypothetical protein
MLDAVYKFVQSHPQEVTWGVIIINGLWIAFAYFSQHRHDKSMKQLEHSLTLERTKRGSLYSLKSTSYERYLRMLDDFGAKNQTQLVARMQPALTTYLNRMVIAAEDDIERKSAIAAFSQEVLLIVDEGQGDFFKLKSESRAIRLTASDALVQLFDELETLVEKSIIESRTFISDLPALLMANDQIGIQKQSNNGATTSGEINKKSQALQLQMRRDLNEI